MLKLGARNAQLTFSPFEVLKLDSRLTFPRSFDGSLHGISSMCARIGRGKLTWLTKFCRSAPLMPGHPLAMTLGSTSTSYVTSPMWCLRIATRPRTSGRPTTTEASQLPRQRGFGGDKLTMPVESTRSSQSLIKTLRKVGSCDNDDALHLLETVQFDQKLVQSLLHVVLQKSAERPGRAQMSSISTHRVLGAPLTTDRIKFIYKDDRWRLLLG